MDEQKLARLRARYTDRGAFDAEDPVLRAAGAAIAKPGDRRTLPYSGISTLLDLPADLGEQDEQMFG